MALVAVGIGALFLAANWTSGEPTSAPQSPVLITPASMDEMFSSTTPADWAANADYVVDASMVEEHAGPSDGSTVRRFGTFKVNKILYSRKGSPPPPASFDTAVWGWSINKDGSRQPMAMRGTSRHMVGHRYILAIRLFEPRCSEGDTPEPGGWGIIGSGASIPFDDGRLGQGELEGSADRTAQGAPGSVLSLVTATGDSDISELTQQLSDAPRQQRQPQPGVRQGC